MGGFYKKYLIETFWGLSEQSEKKVRARPVAGQGLSPNMRVECSSSMRKNHPVGTKFIVDAKITDLNSIRFSEVERFSSRIKE